MQIIINILAEIGVLTVLSIAWVIVIIAMDTHREKKKEGTEEKQTICVLTYKKCIFTNERIDCAGCNGCPIAEEAKKMGTDRVNKNGEGYPDPTFGGAWGNIRREEKQKEAERLAMISNLIPVMKQTAELAGFEVVGRITLRDKGTGKEYK